MPPLAPTSNETVGQVIQNYAQQCKDRAQELGVSPELIRPIGTALVMHTNGEETVEVIDNFAEVPEKVTDLIQTVRPHHELILYTC
jgi:hypothetical protein